MSNFTFPLNYYNNHYTDENKSVYPYLYFMEIYSSTVCTCIDFILSFLSLGEPNVRKGKSPRKGSGVRSSTVKRKLSQKGNKRRKKDAEPEVEPPVRPSAAEGRAPDSASQIGWVDRATHPLWKDGPSAAEDRASSAEEAVQPPMKEGIETEDTSDRESPVSSQ